MEFMMKKALIYLLFTCTVILTGCGILPLIPSVNDKEDIRVTWEETNDNQIVVTYRDKKAKEKEKDKSTGTGKKILGTDTVPAIYKPLFVEVNTWLGTPYSYGLSEKSTGTDCSGFTMQVYRSVYNIQLSRSAEGQAAETREIRKEDLQIGDLVFFNTNGKKISHVGLYIGSNKFVHASVKGGVMVSDLTDKYYVDCYARGGRVLKNH
jgi:cell wall-associated NlpC family hydrolase